MKALLRGRSLATFVVLALLLARAISPARAALWVAVEGDDRNSGSEDRPLRTLQRARDLVRTLNGAMADDIVVFVGRGTYSLAQPLLFGPEDSGTNGFSIIYTATGDERSTVTGGAVVKGWTRAGPAPNLWTADWPAAAVAARHLYVEGRPALRSENRPGAAGQWSFDPAGHRLYYRAGAGEDMRRAEVVLPVAGPLLIAHGTPSRPIAGLVFKGFRFEYGRAEGDAANVSLAFAGGMQFQEDIFLHLDGPGLDLGARAAGDMVEGCIFTDITGPAIAFGPAREIGARGAPGAGTLIDNCHFSNVAVESAGAAAIEGSWDAAIALRHNQFDHLPYRAFSFGPAQRPLASVPGTRPAPAAGVSSESEPNPAADSVPSGDEATDNLIFAAGLSLPEDEGPAAISAPAAARAGAGLESEYRALLAEQLDPPSPPGPPAGIQAEGEDGFAYVAWNPPCFEGGSPVTGYLVEASDGQKTQISAANYRTKAYARILELNNGEPYTFTVTAINARGAGPASLPSPPSLPLHKRRLRRPSAPAGLSALRSGGKVELRWLPPRSDGGSPLLGYVITLNPGRIRIELDRRRILVPPPSPVTFTLDARSLPDASAPIQVSARNCAGEGPVVSEAARPGS